MAGIALREHGAGAAGLEGELDFASVPRLWPELAALIDQTPQLQLSLAGVTSSNSAALALLLEAAEHARQRQHSLSFADLPQGLIDLANLSNVAELVPVAP